MLQGSAERPEQGHSGCGKELLVRVGDEGSPRRSVSATSLYSEGIADLSSAGTPRSGVPASLSHTPTLPHFGMSKAGAALR